MEAKTNYTLVGVVVLILTAGLLSTLVLLSTGFDNKEYIKYSVYINESIHGLNDESPVKFNGVKVGMVDGVGLDKANPQKIKLVLKIAKDVLITESTQATLITQGITGNTFLGLKATSPSLKPLSKAPGERYPVIPYVPSFFSQFEENVATISRNLNTVFDSENVRHLKKSLVSMDDILSAISKNDKQINETLQTLPQVMYELKAGARDFSAMTQRVSNASKQFSETMRAGQNSIDQLNQQTFPNITSLVRRIDLIAANLEEVSALMRQNPAVVIRGTTPQPSGPGE